VADSGNNRVLRFPPGSHDADLVLGQPNFTSRDPGGSPDDTSRLSGPSAVRVGSDGKVYVSDFNNHRILVYGPFGSVAPTPIPGSTPIPGVRPYFSVFNRPEGLTLDPTPGRMWVTHTGDGNPSRLELWAIPTPGLIRTLGGRQDGLFYPYGTIGIDAFTR